MSAIFKSGNYNFLYAALVTQNPRASTYINAVYNTAWVPTVYFDGGDDVMVGATSQQSQYTSRILAAGAREAPDLDFDVSMNWIDQNNVGFTVTITNNEFVNTPPGTPGTPSGPTTGLLEDEHSYSTSAGDGDSDPLYYMWDWGGQTSDWLGPYAAGEMVTIGHTWSTPGDYSVKAKVKDQYDAESPYSSVTTVKIVARGDANSDFGVNLADAVSLINYIFKGGPAPDPLNAGDANCDTAANLADAVYIVNYVFKGGPPPGCQ